MKRKNSNCCVLASRKNWAPEIVANLERRLEVEFILITEPEELDKDRLWKINPRFVFFQHWSHRIHSDIYNNFACVIFHMTDLPFGRGGSPLQNLIIRGISKTKISAIRCIEEMDAGPVYLKRPLNLDGSAQEIYKRASAIIEDMIVTIFRENPEPVPQEGIPIVFERRVEADGNLLPAQTLEVVYDMIRMLDADGYPKAFMEVGFFKLEFSNASIANDNVCANVKISYLENKTNESKND